MRPSILRIERLFTPLHPSCQVVKDTDGSFHRMDFRDRLLPLGAIFATPSRYCRDACPSLTCTTRAADRTLVGSSKKPMTGQQVHGGEALRPDFFAFVAAPARIPGAQPLALVGTDSPSVLSESMGRDHG